MSVLLSSKSRRMAVLRREGVAYPELLDVADSDCGMSRTSESHDKSGTKLGAVSANGPLECPECSILHVNIVPVIDETMTRPHTMTCPTMEAWRLYVALHPLVGPFPSRGRRAVSFRLPIPSQLAQRPRGTPRSEDAVPVTCIKPRSEIPLPHVHVLHSGPRRHPRFWRGVQSLQEAWSVGRQFAQRLSPGRAA